MNEHAPTVSELVDKLKTLGSPDQIALFFESEGIKGQPGNGSSCAIAEYVKRETGKRSASVVSRIQAHNLEFREGWTWPFACDVDRVEHGSEEIFGFMHKFDDLGYPHLIKKD